MSILSSKATLGSRIPRPRLILATTATLIAIAAIIGLILTTGGASAPATEDLLSLGAPTDSAPGAVQLEPGDTPPPTDLQPTSLDGSAALSAVGPGISVGDALASTLDGPLLVIGNIFIADDTTRL